jgi:hypothetical protein
MSKKSPSTTTAQQGPPPQFTSALSDAAAKVQQTAATPYTPYTGQMVADFTPTQQQAFDLVGANVNTAQPYLNQAQTDFGSATRPLWQGVQQFSPDAIQQYMNPYTQNVTAATEAQFANLNAQQQNSLTGSAIQQKAFGGDRAAVAQGVLGGQQAAQEAPVLAGIQQQGYAQAQQEFNQQQQTQLSADEANAWLSSQAAFGEANLGGEAQNLGMSGAQALLGVGNQQQSQAQANLNVPFYQYQAAQAYPFQTAGWEASNLEGLTGAAGGTSSTTTPGPSKGSAVVGGALSGAAMGSMFGPWGTAIGAGVGGLAGAFGARGGRLYARRADGGMVGSAFGGPPGAISPFMPILPDRSNDNWPGPDDSRVGHIEAAPSHGGGSRSTPSPSEAGPMATYLAQIYGALNRTGAGGVSREHIQGYDSGGMLPEVAAFNYAPMIGSGAGGAHGRSMPAPPRATPQQSPLAHPMMPMRPYGAPTTPSDGGKVEKPGQIYQRGWQAGHEQESLWGPRDPLLGPTMGHEYLESPGVGINAADLSNLTSQADFNVASGAPGIRRGGMIHARRGGMMGYDEGGDVDPSYDIERSSDYTGPSEGILPRMAGPPPPKPAAPASDDYAVGYEPRQASHKADDASRMQPWQTGLLAAGLGILGGTSKYAGVNIGRGGLEGVRAFTQARAQQDQQQEREDEQADAGAYKKANMTLEAKRFSDAADAAKQRLKQQGEQMAQTGAHQDTMADIERQKLEQTGKYQQGELAIRGKEADAMKDYRNRGYWEPSAPVLGPDGKPQLDEGTGAPLYTWTNRYDASQTKQGPYDPNSTGRGGKGEGVSQWKHGAWLAAHPGDEQGALDFVAGHKQMGEPDIIKSAAGMASKEWNDLYKSGDRPPPADAPAWLANRSKEIADQLRAGRQQQPGAPGSAPDPLGIR